MKHQLLSALITAAIFCIRPAGAENTGGMAFYPLGGYEQVFLEKRPVVSPLVGLIAQSDGSNPFLGVLTYTARFYEGGLEGNYPDMSHAVNGLIDARNGRTQWLGIFKSESDTPVAGGLATFTIGCAYGYEVVARDGLSVVIGGGAAIGDFGLELPGGKAWPLLPIPLIRVTSESRWIETKFEFLTGPNLTVVVAPRSLFRVTADMRMDRFDAFQDLLFDISSSYRPFAPQGKEADLFGISVGLSNSEIAFDRSEGFYRLQYYSAYGMVDFTLLQARVGYAFKGREIYGDGSVHDPGRGLTLTIQGVVPLGE